MSRVLALLAALAAAGCGEARGGAASGASGGDATIDARADASIDGHADASTDSRVDAAEGDAPADVSPRCPPVAPGAELEARSLEKRIAVGVIHTCGIRDFSARQERPTSALQN